MDTIELGKTGVQVSQISLGTMLMGSSISEETSFAMLDRYFEMGGSFLDTANCYAWWIGKGEFVGDESEHLIGRWMKARKNRHNIFLATKVGARPKDVTILRDKHGNQKWGLVRSAHERLAPKVIHKGIEDSLRRLRTDYVDLYYAHLDDYLTPMDETLSMFSDLAKEGKVRHLGCRNFRAWRLERARQIAATNGWLAYVAWQQEFSYLRPKTGADLGETVHVDDEQLDYLKSNPEVTLIGYSPLLKGIFDDESKRRAYYNWHLFNSEDSLKRIETLSAMSKELGVSNSQLVIAWILNHQPQVIPILAASSMLQFEHNMAAMDIRLSAQQMATLEAAG